MTKMDYTRAPGDRILSSEKSSDIFQGITHSQVGIFYLLNVMIKNLILPIYIYMKSSICLRFKFWICIQISIWFSAGIFYLSGSRIYIYIGFLYVQWITISENKWNSTISPNLMLKNAKHIYMMFCWNILSVGVMYIYICIGFLYVSWFTISNEEWILTFQVVILYGFIAFYLIY